MTLCIHLLGQPRLLWDNHPLQFNAPPKTVPLLAYLLLHRDRSCDRQQIAFSLWPDESESAARTNLRRHIHQLLRALPSADRPWLISDNRNIAWNPQANYWLDVAELETISTQSDRLEEALPLYTGDLLENVYDDWIFFDRERLRNLYLDILSRLTTRQRAARNFPKAIAFAQQLLLKDPFREDAVRLLISLRYEAGDRAGALQEYEAFEHRLREEMGVAPMPETRALMDLVRRNARLPGEVSSQPPAESDTHSTRSVIPSHLPFVGRENEMHLADARWSRSVRGHGGLLLIGGEAGVGKSRLAREIALNIEMQGGRVLYGGVSPSQAGAYQPIIEAFQAALPLLEGLELSPTRMAALATLIPQLSLEPRHSLLPALEPERERIRLFDAVAACLEALAEPRPLLFILEDLHWAGQATLDLLEFLARRAVGKPILFLGTYREEETPRSHPLRKLRRVLQSDAIADHFALGRLSASAVQNMLDQLPADLLPSQTNLAERLFSESEGHPLLIDQLLDFWRQSGQANTNDLPGGIRAAIHARLARLPEGSRAFAEVAAVLGPAFDAEAVREIGGWDEAQAHIALSSLLDSRLARDTEGRSRFDYIFSHHLIQSALYEEIPAPKRKRRHLRAAEILQDLFSEHIERRPELHGELARHFDLGGDPLCAIPHYLKHAQNQISLFADAEALVSINRALELLETNPCPEQLETRIDLLMHRQAIYRRKGFPQKQWDDLIQLRRLVSGRQDAGLEFQVVRLQIDHQRDQRNLNAALDLIQELKACAARLNTPYWNALALQVEGQIYIAQNVPDKAYSLIQEALSTWEALNDRFNQLYCLCYLADIVQTQRKSQEIEELLPKALALCTPETSPAQLMRTLLSAANSGVINNDPQRTLRYANQLASLAERVGDLGWQATAYRLIGIANTHLFNIDPARTHLEKAAQIFLNIQRLKPYAQTLESLGMLEISIGNYQKSRLYHQQSLEIHQRLEQLDGICIAMINLAFVCSLQEDFKSEEDYARKGYDVAVKLGNRYLQAMTLQSLGDAMLSANQYAIALEHFQASGQILQSLGQILELTSVLGDIAITLMKMGQIQSAVTKAEEILSNYEKIKGADDNLHRHLWTAARVFHAAGQGQQAEQLLEQAYQEFQKALETIPDAESRQAFAGLPYNRQIIAARKKAIWP